MYCPYPFIQTRAASPPASQTCLAIAFSNRSRRVWPAAGSMTPTSVQAPSGGVVNTWNLQSGGFAGYAGPVRVSLDLVQPESATEATTTAKTIRNRGFVLMGTEATTPSGMPDPWRTAKRIPAARGEGIVGRGLRPKRPGQDREWRAHTRGEDSAKARQKGPCRPDSYLSCGVSGLRAVPCVHKTIPRQSRGSDEE